MPRAVDFLRDHPAAAGGLAAFAAVVLIGTLGSLSARSRDAAPRAYIAEARTGSADAVAAERARLLAALARPQEAPPKKEEPEEKEPPKKEEAPRPRPKPRPRPTEDPPPGPADDLRLSAVLYTASAAPAAPPAAAPGLRPGWYDAELEGGAAEGGLAVLRTAAFQVEGEARGAGRARRLLIEVRRVVLPDGRALKATGVVAGPDGRPGLPAECHTVSRAAEILALLGAAAAEGVSAAAQWAAIGQGLRTGDVGSTLARQAAASGARTAGDLFREPLRRGEFCIARPQPARVYLSPAREGGAP